MIALNFGCGTNRIDGWQNFDAEIDISKRLPFGDGVADYILAEHVVEHVDYVSALSFFRECRRVLRSGGVVRIAVPSIEQIRQKGDRAYFDFASRWAPSSDVRGAIHAMLFAHGHKAPWTASLLETSLFFAGFDDVVRCDPHYSDHEALEDVEGHHRVIGEHMNSIETCICEAS